MRLIIILLLASILPAKAKTGTASLSRCRTPSICSKGFSTGPLTASSLTVTGNITSPKWKVTQVLETAAGLPASPTFTSSGGTLMFSISGSAWSGTNQDLIINIFLDGSFISVLALGNTISTGFHQTLIPVFPIAVGISSGTHTLTFVKGSGTQVDNDFFNITVMELPF